MKNALVLVGLAAAVNLEAPIAAQQTARLGGEITGALPGNKPVIVRCYKLHVTQTGKVRRLSKHEFYHRTPDAECLAEGTKFDVGEIPTGQYSIVAFQDLDGDGELDYDPCEPLGWYTTQAAGWIDALDLGSGVANIGIQLRRTTPFPAHKKLDGYNGELTRTNGIATLRIRGTPEERGRAHGALVGRQILDFFEFYVLEDKFKSVAKYRNTFYRFLEANFRYPKEFLTEIDAVIAGMKATGLKMSIDTLGRDFDRTDLLAINAYIESRAMRSSCTQFAFWGVQSTDGGTIAGRNMDGEIDLRKTTVSHFLVIAVDQGDKTRKRYLNLMWPGFVGTITGINEDGLYSMENAGGTGPGPVVDSLVPCSWIQRFILENVSGQVTPDAVTRIIDAHRSSGGGSFGAGSIILFATPFRGQKAPAFVYEGDRFGGAMRLPGEVRPKGMTHIMATNHHLK